MTIQSDTWNSTHKCQVLTITRKRKPVHFPYELHGHQLEHLPSAKYLGIKFKTDLRWSEHINDITTKATRILGFLRHNLQISSPRLKTVAYKTLVRPLLEFAPSVWDPYYQTDINKFEMVQRRAALYVTNRHNNRSSVTGML